MSAICGIYHSNGRPVSPAAGADMMRKLAVYPADAAWTWSKEQVFFGCHAQFITPESARGILPYRDEKTALTITADAILDNRMELCEKTGINHACRRDIPDSLLILQAYNKWGKDCPKYLLGDYSFAIWDEKRQELFCAVDHTGTRTFYYYHAAGLFAFSTLIEPLFALPEIDKIYSKTWIADFLAIPTVMHQLDPELTLYKNIYLLPAGHRMTIRPGGAAKQVYWQVQRQPELKLKSDGEYEEAFREVLGTAVRCRMRSRRPAGVMLSGGLDSTSVACLAARELAGSDRRLLAFSAVPMAGYRDWLPEGRLADETQYIEAVKEHAGNIDVIYCRTEGKHALSDTDRLMAILEQPYKLIENFFWLDGIMATAREHGVGVVLFGSAGNTTISWGYVQPYLLSMFRAGQWLRLLQESWAYARRCRYPLKVMRRLMRTLLPLKMPKDLYRSRNQGWGAQLTPINPDFARHTAVQERVRRAGYDPSLTKPLDSFESRKVQLTPEFFSHGGVFTTKLALAYGVAWRDPTIDKRVIDFCLSVPESQYVRDGRERFLVRRAMAGLVADKVLQNETLRGRQGADWVQRLQPHWPDMAAEIRSIGARKAEREYLNIDRIAEELTRFSKLDDAAAKDGSLRMLLRSLIFSRFLRREEGIKGCDSTISF